MENPKDEKPQAPTRHRGSAWSTALFWVLAVVLMLGSAVYQRMTGPTHPLRGSVDIGGQETQYKLLRTEEIVRDARIAIPTTGLRTSATLRWRRFKIADEFTAVPMGLEHTDAGQKKILSFTIDTPAKDELVGYLPAQPMAGKLEYYISVADISGGHVRIPAEDQVVIRFKGVVPLWALVPHIFFMFFGVLWGFRTLLEALAGRSGVRWMSWTTFILFTIGGMFFGPLVQLYAFGAWWTGVPFGWDLTDNKTLIMWICWLVAVLFIGWRRVPVKPLARWMTVLAAIVMLAVYLVPHSMFGSELKYDQLEEGMDPTEAIGQG